MRSSTRLLLLLFVIVIPTATAIAGYCIGMHHRSAGSEQAKSDEPATTEEDKPVVPVVTAPLAVSTITETVKAYGTVVAEAADVHAVSVAFESRVSRVLVTPGQQVNKGTPLAAVE